ncbi:MAG: hypothetical protein SVK54_03615 [candidate division WOR-3 bacterium]|nr:hypothetical protein [candidate division WOR-3 bacterium]
MRSSRYADVLCLSLMIIFTSVFLYGETEVNFYGNAYISDSRIESIFNGNNINASIEKVMNLYLNNGFPFIEIVVDSTEQIGDKDILYLDIIENSRFTVQSIENRGDISSGLVASLLRLNGSVFSKELVDERMRQLDDTDYLINYSNYTLRSVNDSSLVIITDIRRNASSSLSGALSLRPDSLQIAGVLEVHLISAFGMGARYDLVYNRINQDRSNLELTGNIPFVFSSPLGIEFSGHYSNIDTSLAVSSIHGKTYIKWRRFTFSTGAGKQWYFYNYSPDSNESYTGLSAGVILKYNEFNVINTDYAYYLGDKSYSRFSYQLHAGHEFETIGVLLSLAGSWMPPAEGIGRSLYIPIGGSRSVRGYPDDFIYVRDKMEYSAGVYYRFSSSVDAGLFFDAGFYRFRGNQSLIANSICAGGPFLRFNTQNTGIDLYIANNSFSITGSRIHITLSYRF